MPYFIFPWVEKAAPGTGLCFGSAGTSRGVPCLLPRAFTRLPERRRVTDNMLQISSAGSRSIPGFCLLPAAGRGAAELLAPPSPPAGPSPPALPWQEESKTQQIWLLNSFQEKLLSHCAHSCSITPLWVFRVKVKWKCSRFVLAKEDAKNPEADGSAPRPVANPRKGLKQPAFNSADTALRVTHPSFQLIDWLAGRLVTCPRSDGEFEGFMLNRTSCAAPKWLSVTKLRPVLQGWESRAEGAARCPPSECCRPLPLINERGT